MRLQKYIVYTNYRNIFQILFIPSVNNQISTILTHFHLYGRWKLEQFSFNKN